MEESGGSSSVKEQSQLNGRFKCGDNKAIIVRSMGANTPGSTCEAQLDCGKCLHLGAVAIS